MIYDLTHFGLIFQALRKSNEYSYKSLSEASNIAKNTLRNIERGKVIPNIETLSILSNFLKVDLTLLFLQCKSDRYKSYESLKHQFEKMIAEHIVDNLTKLMSQVESLLSYEPHTDEDIQLNLLLTQLYHRMIGQYETSIKKNNNNALSAYLHAIRITQPNFDLDHYKRCMLNYDELSIFFNVVQMLNRREKKELHQKMYHHIFECYNQLVEKEIFLFPTLVNNMAVNYLHLGRLNQALEFANIGIDFVKAEQTTIDLPALLLCKGIVYEKLGNPDGRKYIGLSFDLLKLKGRWDIIEFATKELLQTHKIHYEA